MTRTQWLLYKFKCSTLINYLISTKQNLWHQPQQFFDNFNTMLPIHHHVFKAASGMSHKRKWADATSQPITKHTHTMEATAGSASQWHSWYFRNIFQARQSCQPSVHDKEGEDDSHSEDTIIIEVDVNGKEKAKKALNQKQLSLMRRRKRNLVRLHSLLLEKLLNIICRAAEKRLDHTNLCIF